MLILSLVFSQGCRRFPPQPPSVASPQPGHVQQQPEDYLEIETIKRQLRVCKGSEVLSEFLEIRFGAAGVGIKKKRGDGITPIGNFAIEWITRNTKFHIFVGINYPSIEYANRGLTNGIISKEQFTLIERALAEGRTPPQDTPLGGMIGLHGIGRGSLKTHKLVNWTEGCVALDNGQIEKLVKFTHIGMPVFIREQVEGRCSSLQL